uniref:Uncharacterized protein n=1 Tax=Porodaedalea pini TaxID=108901 RepID=A0A5B9R901_9AGAM|nr:hypothetical protein PPIT_000057 [Porodaedalea pini]QEG56938.1 hypothetical protein PPIT_000057 [Porodaedalea pini]
MVSAPKTVVKKIWRFFTNRKKGDNDGGLGQLPQPAATRAREYRSLWETVRGRIGKGKNRPDSDPRSTAQLLVRIGDIERMEGGGLLAEGSRVEDLAEGSSSGVVGGFVTGLRRRGDGRPNSR